MDKENGSGGGSSKHKNSSNSSRQPTIDVNDPSSLLNAASLFGKSFVAYSIYCLPAHKIPNLRTAQHNTNHIIFDMSSNLFIRTHTHPKQNCVCIHMFVCVCVMLKKVFRY